MLKKLNSIDVLKSMKVDELKKLAEEIRNSLIVNVSNTGGHLASNLGVVELTIAVHRVFNSPKDQIVFDVGHQCYVHKILTGRYEEFKSLRKKDGISGFPNPDESVHDIFKSGHSSTSISAALGLASANSINNVDSTTVAVIGDGSMTGGLAYEGLNNAGNSGKKLVVILNDNKMSISENVGSISKTLLRLRSKSGYFKVKDFLSDISTKTPCIGKPLYRWLVKLKSAIKHYFYSPNIFESMGFKYLGPIDGHNIELLVRMLDRAKSLECPVLIHVKTKKGKGYSFAENQPHKFHGVGEFDIGTGTTNASEIVTFSDAFGRSLLSLSDKNNKICAITAAMGDSCGLKTFKFKYPDRYFDVGIAEQHAVTFACGLAKNGFIPVFAVYSTFLQRAYDQIIHDISLQKLKVIFAIDRAGIVGSDGETHQGLFDVPMLLPIPNIKIYSPATASELEYSLSFAVEKCETSVAIRYPKANAINYSDYPFKTFDDWELIENFSDTVVISYGFEIHEVIKAVKSIRVDLLKLNLINEFSHELLFALDKYKKIVFVEEGYLIGGVASLLLSKLNERGIKGEFHVIAIENGFIKHALQSESKKELSLDSDSIAKNLHEILSD